MEHTPKYTRNKKAFIYILIAIGIVWFLVSTTDKNGSGSNGPTGKGFMLVNQLGYGEYSFGDTYREADNFLNYGWEYLDGNGNAIRNIRRTGHFTVSGNTINCFFNDGQPPYKIEYKQNNSGGCIVDESGQVWSWDDPSKRKK